MLYPLSYGAAGQRLAEAAGNTRHTRLVTTGEPGGHVRGYRSTTRQAPATAPGGRKAGSMDAKVVDVPERGRFEVRVDDRVVGLASYHVDGTTMTLPHTEVDPSVGGQGIGTALVAGVLAAARERGLTVLPYCSFVRHYIQQHPELMELVAAEDRPHFGLETADR
jgi:uncharacterized protein